MAIVVIGVIAAAPPICHAQAVGGASSGATVVGQQIVRLAPAALALDDRSPLGLATLRFDGAARGRTGPFAVLRRGALRIGPVTIGALESWLAARREGDDLVFEAPVHPFLGSNTDYVALDLSAARDYEHPPRLEPDPRDVGGPADRPPLVLVHGATFHERGSADDSDKLAIWDAIRRHPRYRGLMARYRPFLFRYPTYRAVDENGRALTALVDRTIGIDRLRSRSVALVGHSMGGLVIRHAMNSAGLGEKVGVALTLATPHHGSVLASLLEAQWAIAGKIGLVNAIALKIAAARIPPVPGLFSIRSDNHDGGLTPEDRAAFRIPVNDALAAFEARERYRDRLVCFQADVHDLIGHGMFGIEYEFVRRGCQTFHPMYGNIDPLVPFASGLFEGQPVRATMSFPGIDHGTILTDARVLSELFDVLEGGPIGRARAAWL